MIFSTTKSKLFRCRSCGKIVYRNSEDRFTNINDENLCDKCFKNKFNLNKKL